MPETGYGCIATLEALPELMTCSVEAFREKPLLGVALENLAVRNYYWNAGIFVWSVDTIVDSFCKFKPDLYAKKDQMVRTFSAVDEPS